METIQLPQEELLEMKKFYQEEYDQTSKKLAHILNVLQRLGIEAPKEVRQIPLPVLEGGLSGSPGQGASGARKRSGRKSKWELMIMKRLRQLDKPVTYEELTDEIMVFSKIPPEKRKSTKQAVVNVVFRLRSRDQKVDTFSVGTREKYIALNSWFDEKGQISKEYKAKISDKIPKKRRGRKRKPGRPRKKA